MKQIKFNNGLTINCEKNANCYISEKSFEVPIDLSLIEITDTDNDQTAVLKNAKFIECASIDDRFWFSFEESTPEEILRSDLDYLAIMTDVVLPSME